LPPGREGRISTEGEGKRRKKKKDIILVHGVGGRLHVFAHGDIGRCKKRGKTSGDFFKRKRRRCRMREGKMSRKAAISTFCGKEGGRGDYLRPGREGRERFSGHRV